MYFSSCVFFSFFSRSFSLHTRLPSTVVFFHSIFNRFSVFWRQNKELIGWFREEFYPSGQKAIVPPRRRHEGVTPPWRRRRSSSWSTWRSPGWCRRRGGRGNPGHTLWVRWPHPPVPIGPPTRTGDRLRFVLRAVGKRNKINKSRRRKKRGTQTH